MLDVHLNLILVTGPVAAGRMLSVIVAVHLVHLALPLALGQTRMSPHSGYPAQPVARLSGIYPNKGGRREG